MLHESIDAMSSTHDAERVAKLLEEQTLQADIIHAQYEKLVAQQTDAAGNMAEEIEAQVLIGAIAYST